MVSTAVIEQGAPGQNGANESGQICAKLLPVLASGFTSQISARVVINGFGVQKIYSVALAISWSRVHPAARSRQGAPHGYPRPGVDGSYAPPGLWRTGGARPRHRGSRLAISG